MYINGNLGQLVSNTVGTDFGMQPLPIEQSGLVDPADQFLPNIPGTNIPVNVKPATDQLSNMLVYLAIAGVVLLMMRSR